MAEHGAQFGFAGDACGVGDADGPLGRLDVLVEREPGCVDHERVVAEDGGLLEDAGVVHPDVIFVDHGDVVQMEPDAFGLEPRREGLEHGLQPFGLKLVPLEARRGHKPDGIGLGHGPHDGFDHGQVGYVERRNHEPRLERVLHDLGAFCHANPFLDGANAVTARTRIGSEPGPCPIRPRRKAALGRHSLHANAVSARIR